MDKISAIHVFRQWDRKGRCVFTKQALRKLFSQDSPQAFTEGLHRLVKAGLLQRACRGIYVNHYAQSLHSRVIEEIAKTLRSGEYNYVSLESMLSEYGIISQIPTDRLTVMTTGRKGIYKTPYGTIEFTHTKRSVANILENIRPVEGRPLRIATQQAAWRDLKRVGRNCELVNRMELEDE